MRPAADEVDAIDILEAVMWPEVEKLPDIVREVKSRAAMNLGTAVPNRPESGCARNGCAARDG